MKKENLVWFNNEIVESNHALIDIMSATSQYGINVFEGIRAYKNTNNKLGIFRLDDHIERLFNSCKLFSAKSKYSKSEIKNAIKTTVKSNNFIGDVGIRVMLYNGNQESWSSESDLDLFISPILKGRTLIENKKGFTCAISSFKRIDNNSVPPQIKSGANYINSRYGQIEASNNGYDTCIFLDNLGFVSEGPGSNIFIVKNNKLITPKLSNSILDGITRDTIINISRNILKMDVEVREITKTELLLADEAFLCGSAMEIVPVIQINNIKLNAIDSNSFTKKIFDLYFSLIRGEIENYHHWITLI